MQSQKKMLFQPCSECSSAANLRCSLCSDAFYCGTDCQKKAWPVHKAQCKDTVNERSKTLTFFFCFKGSYVSDRKGGGNGEGCIAGKGGVTSFHDQAPKYAFRTEAAAIRYRAKLTETCKNEGRSDRYEIGSATVIGSRTQVFELLSHGNGCTCHMGIYAKKSQAEAKAAEMNKEKGEEDTINEVLPVEILDEHID
jgi:hypothetical protein